MVTMITQINGNVNTYLNLIKNIFGPFEMVEFFPLFIMVKIQLNGIKCFSNLMLDSFMSMLWAKKRFRPHCREWLIRVLSLYGQAGPIS